MQMQYRFAVNFGTLSWTVQHDTNVLTATRVLVRTVPAVLAPVALPARRHATAVFATELGRRTATYIYIGSLLMIPKF